MHFKNSIIYLALLAQTEARASSCDMDAYCRAQVGPLSYCKNWLAVSSCQLGDQVKNCTICGVVSSGTVAGTTAPTTSTSSKASTPTTAAVATTTPTTSTSSKASTTTTAAVATTTRPPSATVATIASTTRASSSTTTAGKQTACDMHAYCRAKVGLLSYCKDWQAVSSCQGGDQVTNCTTCGGLAGSTTRTPSTTTRVATIVPATTTRPSTTVPASTAGPTTAVAQATTCDMHAYCRSVAGVLSYCKDWLNVPSCAGADQFTNCPTCGAVPGSSGSTITRASPVTTPVDSAVTKPAWSDSDCEARPSSEAPMFMWVELPNIRARSDYIVFYQKLKVFLDKNCVNLKVATLVVRVISPYFPSADPMYWPPESSPLFSELIAKLSPSNSPLKVVLYPYLMEEDDRNNWVRFATSQNLKPVNVTLQVYDGVFGYTKMWQDFVAERTTAATIDGFMIDYEEIWKAMGTKNSITLTPESFAPFRAAYPSVRTGTSIGYDNGKQIRYFDPIMDYLHLQVYDFYYPYPSADKSKTDSIFEVYKNDPQGFLEVVLKHVLTPTVLKAYQGREDKIKLMWSTQTLRNDCIYLMNDGTCGMNYEFNWDPVKFNEFVHLALKSAQLGPFEHGIYTYNFINPSWVIKSSRP